MSDQLWQVRIRQELAQNLPTSDDQLSRHLRALVLDPRGKLLRPRLFLLGYQAGGGIVADDPAPWRVAAALEMVHCASLIHDDIIDAARQRRGMPSLHTITTVRQAILAGDYLFSTALFLAGDRLAGSRTRDAGAALRALCLGEMSQDSHMQDPAAPSRRQYRRQATGKTALLFALSLRGGARMALDEAGRSDDRLEEGLGRWAHAMGMAFQIADDLLDYRLEDTDKGSFKDLPQGVLNYPLLVALESAEHGGTLRKLVNRHGGTSRPVGRRDRERLWRLVELAGGFTAARDAIDAYGKRAALALGGARVAPDVQGSLREITRAWVPASRPAVQPG